MFGKKSEKRVVYHTTHISSDDPRVRCIWFTLWYSFISLVFITTFFLVLTNAPFNLLGILVCLLTFTAYILNTNQMRFMSRIHRSPYWLFIYILFFALYINYIHPYVSFIYNLNIFIAYVSIYHRFSQFLPTFKNDKQSSS